MTSSQHGRSMAGLPIAAGGFGCVFKPALKCVNSPPGIDRKNGISKLMISTYAKEELAETNDIKPILETIPGYKEYFLVQDITICTPDKLTASDLQGFNSKCNNLTSYGLNISNVNNHLDKLKSLDIPYGGIDISQWLSLKPLTENRFNKLNKALLNLLYNGIIPANKRNLFHCDVKGGNILIDNKYKARIIDWGLSGIYNGPASINDMKFNRVFQYNLPFTSIILDKRFQAIYAKAFRMNNLNLNSDIEEFKVIAINYIYYYIDNISRGHYSYIKTIMGDLFSPLLAINSERGKQVIDYTFTLDIIATYIATVLKDYTIINSHGARFEATKYFTEVFSHNIDIWGFIMTYIDIFSPTQIINMKSVRRAKMFKSALRSIIIKYCYSSHYASRPIPINELIEELSYLSSIIGQPKPTITKHIKLNAKSSRKRKLVSQKTTKKANIIIKKQSHPKAFAWDGKRCPRGTRRNKKTNMCEKV